MRHIKLFSIPISITSKSEALAIITRWVIKWHEARSTKRVALKIFPHAARLMPRAKLVTTPNPEMIVAAQKDSKFLRALQGADLAIPDGIGVVAALRLLHASRLHRISGLSLMEDLIDFAAQNGWRVMLVGGRSGVAAQAAEKLKLWVMSSELGSEGGDASQRTTHNSRLDIVGLSAPPDITHASPHDLDHLITSINRVKPDLLFVAFGHGKQEKWMVTSRDRLAVGVMMGVGGALDQIVDPSLRPPAYIDSIGLGWLYRLMREPWRWRRQLALVKFAWMLFRVFLRRIRSFSSSQNRVE